MKTRITILKAIIIAILLTAGNSAVAQNDDSLHALPNIEARITDDDNFWDPQSDSYFQSEKAQGNPDIPRPDEFVDMDKEPYILNKDSVVKRIGYPQMAQDAEIEGTVIIRVLVDTLGRYVKHIVLKDPHPILTRPVEQKAPQLEFSPGSYKGKPVYCWVSIPFKFVLPKKQ